MTNPPIRLTPLAIDLRTEVGPDEDRTVVLDVFDASGIRLTIPMAADHAEQFGQALAAYAGRKARLKRHPVTT